MPVTIRDFVITWTDETFRWAGEARPGVPILHWPCGAICEPIVLHLAHSLAGGRLRVSTARNEAYSLRAWMAWLWSRGTPWWAATDRDLRAWRTERLARKQRRRSGSRRQAERDCGIVWRFYADHPEAAILTPARRRPEPFVGQPALPRPSFTSRTTHVETRFGRVERTCWAWAGSVSRGGKRRPTPGADDVALVLERLRSRAAVAPSRRRNRSGAITRELACERDWMAARLMAEAGMRSAEVEALTMEALAAALHGEGAPGLASASDPWSPDQAARARILARLGALEAAGRRVIEVEVDCKGAVRGVPFTITLMRDLLVIGVWSVRATMVRAWVARHPRAVTRDAVFLSTKTGLALAAGSIGRTVRDAFRAAGSGLSAHRLRAYFAETMALALLEERCALNGGRLDGSVIAWVLRRVADALGHASSRTTAAAYVDRAVLRMRPAATARPPQDDSNARAPR